MFICMALWRVFRPKSLLIVLIDVLIYFFHAHFDLGLKVRLFARHNAQTPVHTFEGRTSRLERLFDVLFEGWRK